MNAETVFSIANLVALAGWLSLIFAPRWKWTQKIVVSGAVSLLLSVAYLVLIVLFFGKAEGGFGSLADVMKLFTNPYAAKIYISPAFAERTGFTDHDLEVLFEALGNMFEHDRSAARGEMVVRGIYDFEHTGTQHENNAEANKREARLGCAHAHKLFEGIKVDLKKDADGNDVKEFPESFADYEVVCDWTNENLPKGVKLHKRHE